MLKKCHFWGNSFLFLIEFMLGNFFFSESSMFVARHRFILKTCGTTTPLQCLKPLMLLVEQYTGFDEVEVIIQKGSQCSLEGI
jgi:hypothetical protein